MPYICINLYSSRSLIQLKNNNNILRILLSGRAHETHAPYSGRKNYTPKPPTALD